ncbi:MAG: insulinase family protein [Calditrichaeota bacterium]|nr:insulinase family protein [Calditrichota bacterium]
MKKILLLGFIFSLLTSVLWAQGKDESKIFPYKYEMRDLDNGLRVVVIPTDYPNIVALQIPVMTGSRNEVEKGKSGFAHFFEHMMFRGTEKYPADKYNEILKNAGADQNAWTSDDMTNYHITFSKEDLETVLKLEADRFQNLKYSIEDFKTESRAVLGEYNKNYANPVRKLFEVQRNNAFTKHTYKHTTMGFIEDIEDMPNQYDYSLKFFNRFYRPEYVSIILAGDLDVEKTFDLVEKYWSGWKRGDYKADIPAEPEPEAPVYEHIKWDTPTLPWITVAFHGPAFSENQKDMPAMDLIAQYAFSSSSPLYQKLVVKEQVADAVWASFPDHTDPFLLTVGARIKDVKDIWYVRDEITKAFAEMRYETVSSQRLSDIKGNMKYGFAQGMDNSEAIASSLVGYMARTRDPETIKRVYNLYDQISANDIKKMANKYFTDNRMVVVSLSHEETPDVASKTGSIDAIVKANANVKSNVESLVLKSESPVIDFKFLFNAGSANDPKGKEGLANLTASMISGGGSKDMKYSEIQKALYPMAAWMGDQVDKEMTVFMGTTHIDNLNNYYEIVSQQILNPAWDEDDFNRIKTNVINGIKVGLRGNNDEELGKEVMYEMIYENHPYGHLNYGHIEALEKLTLDDVKQFYKENYTQANLVLGLAGNVSEDFVNKVKHDLAALPEGTKNKVKLPQPEKINGFEVEIVKKETRATGISFGFPISINRSDEDFAALWLVRSYFGEHRSSNSYLYQRIREIRGMNYGDYAYIEYFPRGMFQFHPDANLGRQQQIFQVWIRPVVPENAHFAVRTAMYELNKLVNEGMSQEDFETTRNYLMKFVNILTKTQSRQLGYALDSKYYNISEFTKYITDGLKNLTVDDVNKVIKKYLQTENIKFAFITKDAEGLKEQLVSNTTSPIKYDADKPQSLLDEDKIIQDYKLDFKADKVKVVDVENVFK